MLKENIHDWFMAGEAGSTQPILASGNIPTSDEANRFTGTFQKFATSIYDVLICGNIALNSNVCTSFGDALTSDAGDCA